MNAKMAQEILTLKAQAENQHAQARNYETQNTSPLLPWLPFFGSLIVAAVGVFTSIAIANKNNNSNNLISKEKLDDDRAKRKADFEEEVRKRNEQLKKEKDQIIRTSASELMKCVSAGFHSLTWILWIAYNTKADYKDDVIKAHNDRMIKIYEDIGKEEIVVCSYSIELFTVLKPIIATLYYCDGDVGRFNDLLKTKSAEKDDTLSCLGALRKPVYDYAFDIAENVGRAINQALSGSSSVDEIKAKLDSIYREEKRFTNKFSAEFPKG